jgi:hypothetical protein
MDALDGLLDGPRARGAFLLRSILEPPWCLRIQDEALLTLVAMVRGQAWVLPEHGQMVYLQRHDAALLRGPDPYTVSDDPATPPQVVIHPGQRCTTLDGHDLAQSMDLGVRTWGNHPYGSTSMITGTYQLQSAVGTRVLAVLPTLLVMPGGSWESPLIPLLTEELIKDQPGQHVMLDRLLDLLLIAVLRAWLAPPKRRRRPGTGPWVTRWWVRHFGCSSTARPSHGRWRSWPQPRMCREPRWRAASVRSSGSLPWPFWLVGGWPWRPTCCASQTPPWRKWPIRWGTPAHSRSARPSNGFGGQPATAPVGGVRAVSQRRLTRRSPGPCASTGRGCQNSVG